MGTASMVDAVAGGWSDEVAIDAASDEA